MAAQMEVEWPSNKDDAGIVNPEALTEPRMKIRDINKTIFRRRETYDFAVANFSPDWNLTVRELEQRQLARRLGMPELTFVEKSKRVPAARSK